MKKTRNGLRRYSREYKVGAVRRVAQGEGVAEVARDLGIPYQVLWKWRRVAEDKGEEHLHEWGRRKTVRGSASKSSGANSGQGGRIAELEQLVGRQQMEIGFLDRALCRVEEQRQPKNDGGEAASTKR